MLDIDPDARDFGARTKEISLEEMLKARHEEALVATIVEKVEKVEKVPIMNFAHKADDAHTSSPLKLNKNLA